MLRTVRREDLLKELKKDTGKISYGAEDTIERVAKFGKDIRIEQNKLKVTFGSNLYTIVEEKAVEVVRCLNVCYVNEKEYDKEYIYHTCKLGGKEMIIKLNKEDVSEFVNIATGFGDADIDLTKDNYTIDAKSTIGVYSLDLSSPIRLDVHKVEIDREKEIYAAFNKFKA